MPEKNRKLSPKNLAMLPSYFDYIFEHKARLEPELSPKFLSNLGPNPTQKALSDLQLWVEALLTLAGCATDCTRTSVSVVYLNKLWQFICRQSCSEFRLK